MRNQISILSTRVWIVLLISLFIPIASSLTQVTIKERVPIAPGLQSQNRKHPQMVFLYIFNVTTDMDTISILDTAHIQVVFWSLVSNSELYLDPNTRLTFAGISLFRNIGSVCKARC